MARSAVASILLTTLMGVVGVPAMADDACVDFKWDVSRERALFAGAATPLTAAADPKAAPEMQLNHLYEVTLQPQEKVAFAVTPGKKNPRAGSHAGLLTFKIPSNGSYRVAIDMPFYIDVVSNGALVAATDFQGQRGCSSPHKIVMFDLAGNRPLFLQLSNADPDSVRLTITATPVRKL
jgi:hypothetical protein